MSAGTAENRGDRTLSINADAEKEGTNRGRQRGRSSVLPRACSRRHRTGGPGGWQREGAEHPAGHVAEPLTASGAGAAPRRTTAGAGVLRRWSKTGGSTQLAPRRALRSKFTALVERCYGQNMAKLLQVQRAPERQLLGTGRG